MTTVNVNAVSRNSRLEIRTGIGATAKYLDTSTILGIIHGDVEDRDIGYNVGLSCILRTTG